MESTKKTLIQWIEISEKVDNGETLNPIDQFIYDNSPAGLDEENLFREQLLLAINYENEEIKTDRNANIISSFIEHCKNKGLRISDTLFESYFEA